MNEEKFINNVCVWTSRTMMIGKKKLEQDSKCSTMTIMINNKKMIQLYEQTFLYEKK